MRGKDGWMDRARGNVGCPCPKSSLSILQNPNQPGIPWDVNSISQVCRTQPKSWDLGFWELKPPLGAWGHHKKMQFDRGIWNESFHKQKNQNSSGFWEWPNVSLHLGSFLFYKILSEMLLHKDKQNFYLGEFLWENGGHNKDTKLVRTEKKKKTKTKPGRVIFSFQPSHFWGFKTKTKNLSQSWRLCKVQANV